MRITTNIFDRNRCFCVYYEHEGFPSYTVTVMTKESSMDAHKISTITAAKIRFFLELRKFII